MQFLMAYDIFDDKRRRKIAKELYQYSDSYQKSALVADLKKTDMKRIVGFLQEICKEKDSAILFRIKCGFSIGKTEDVEFVI